MADVRLVVLNVGSYYKKAVELNDLTAFLVRLPFESLPFFSILCKYISPDKFSS